MYPAWEGVGTAAVTVNGTAAVMVKRIACGSGPVTDCLGLQAAMATGRYTCAFLVQSILTKKIACVFFSPTAS